MRTRTVLIGVALLLAVAATACDSGKSSGKPGSSRTPGSTSPISPTPAAEQDALTAYRGMWNAWVQAGKTSNPDEPALRTYTSGEALKLIVGALLTNQHNEQVSQGAPVINPKVAEVKPPEAPTQATVNDCVNDENWLMYKASGGLVNDIPGGRHNMTATVTLVDSTWKVSYFKLGKVGTC